MKSNPSKKFAIKVMKKAEMINKNMVHQGNIIYIYIYVYKVTTATNICDHAWTNHPKVGNFGN